MARTLCVWYPEWTSRGEKGPDGPSDEARPFEPVVQALEALVPRVEVATPGLAFVPVGGAVGYYGGEEPLVRAVAQAIPPGARLGVADGPFAARCAAEEADEANPMMVEDTAAFLSRLEVGRLGVDGLVETFRWLGVTTLGDLARLPREAVASRFGAVGLAAHRLASGEDRTLHPRPIPAELTVESLHHDDPLTTAEQVTFVARGLAVRLLAGLAAEGLAPYRVLVEVESAGGVMRRRMWRSWDPFTDQALAERVWWQVRAWMEEGVVGGVVRIRLDPTDLSDEGRQLALLKRVGESWQEADGGRHDVERALDRVQALVGTEAVRGAHPRGGRMPVERVGWYRQGDTSLPEPTGPWPGAIPPPSPALVPEDPPPLEVEWEDGIPARVRLGTRWEPVLNWSGPWRMVGRWWRGESAVDRYQLVTSAGALLFVVGDDGRAFLSAVYD